MNANLQKQLASLSVLLGSTLYWTQSNDFSFSHFFYIFYIFFDKAENYEVPLAAKNKLIKLPNFLQLFTALLLYLNQQQKQVWMQTCKISWHHCTIRQHNQIISLILHFYIFLILFHICKTVRSSFCAIACTAIKFSGALFAQNSHSPFSHSWFWIFLVNNILNPIFMWSEEPMKRNSLRLERLQRKCCHILHQSR